MLWENGPWWGQAVEASLGSDCEPGRGGEEAAMGWMHSLGRRQLL